MPLLKAKPGAIPADHSGCDPDNQWKQCPACKAGKGLTLRDWEIVKYYSLVQDLVRNQAPLGTEDNKPYTTPILSDWIAIAKLLKYEELEIFELVDAARFLHRAVEGRTGLSVSRIHRMDRVELEPPEI